MSNNMAKITDIRKTVEQLKLEVNIERMMVSKEWFKAQWLLGTRSFSVLFLISLGTKQAVHCQFTL